MENYKEAGFVVFPFKLSYNEEKQKKEMIYPKGYNDLTTKDIINRHPTWTGLAMRMGIEYEKGKYIILIDVDNKGEDKNGYNLWNKWKTIDATIENTTSETTPSGGKHYYYYVTENQKQHLHNMMTTMDGYAIDYKFTNQLAIITPSYYIKGKEKKEYKKDNFYIWEKKIIKLPEVIFETIKKEHERLNQGKPSLKKKIVLNHYKKLDASDFTIKCTLEDIKEHLKYIGNYDNYERYRDLGFLLKNLNHESLSLYIEWCKQWDKYNENDVISSWRTHKPVNGLSLACLLKYIKDDKISGYESLIGEVKEEKKYKSLIMKERYLSDSKTMLSAVEQWLTGEGKFLSIKSPYGTGKTTLLKHIFDNYDISEMRILFITYRRTLAQNTAAVFTEYNFKNYLDGIFHANKQIIQLDSIERLEHSYDLIIIDEIESVLCHLTGETIKKTNQCLGNAEHIYKILRDIIENASKVICMDGDYHNRAHTFLSSFNQEVKVIENTIKFDGKMFLEFHNKDNFNDLIIHALEKNKKIVITCMSAGDVLFYHKMISEKFKDKKVYMYTSKTGDTEKKEDFKDINVTWRKADAIIYSPTIESGVDFNIKHFDNLFIVYSAKSTSPRGLFQMMNRIRKFNSNKVAILFEGLGKEGNAMSYKEMAEYYTGIVKRDLTDFDKIYVYNLLEQHESQKRFYCIWKSLMEEKGHTLKTMDDKTKGMKKASICRKKILEASTITEEQYNEYLKKQKLGKATTEEKWKIEKFTYMTKFGINEIDEDFMKHYYNKRYIIDNHLCVVDKRNIKFYNYKDMEDKNFDLQIKIKQVECVTKMINALGYKHCYDNSKLKELNLDKALEYVSEYYKLINKKAIINDTNKGKIGVINGILHEYGLEVKANKTSKMTNGKKKTVSVYLMCPRHDINIYVQNKINLGRKIYDGDNLFKPLTYDE